MLSCCCAAKDDSSSSIVEAKAAVTSSSVPDEEVPIKAVAPPPTFTDDAKVIEPKPAREWFTASFDVELVKMPGETFGVEVDTLDNEVMQVCMIRDGIVSKYNATAAPGKDMKLGDFLVNINGVGGSTEAMVERMKRDDKFKISVRRLKTWEATLKQKPSQIRPSMNRAANGRTILVLNANDKPVRDWNAANPDLAIKENDRIVMINGVENESDKMMEQVEQASDLKILVGRPSP